MRLDKVWVGWHHLQHYCIFLLHSLFVPIKLVYRTCIVCPLFHVKAKLSIFSQLKGAFWALLFHPGTVLQTVAWTLIIISACPFTYPSHGLILMTVHTIKRCFSCRSLYIHTFRWLFFAGTIVWKFCGLAQKRRILCTQTLNIIIFLLKTLHLRWAENFWLVISQVK